MKYLEVSIKTYKRLEKFVTSFNETHETVLERLIDHYEKSSNQENEYRLPAPTADVLSVNIDVIPNLQHTKLLDAKIGDERPKNIFWNGIVELALIKVKEGCIRIEELASISGANVVAGRKENEGYRFVPAQMFSFQGVNASNAAEIVYRCAKKMESGGYLEFEWRQKPKAHMPGVRAKLDLPSSFNH